ncbi:MULTISPECIES: 4Fe-4S binding protein [unclassified Methanoregula]|uniref:4Fe-4S binding protein n=1 Tax=unclassified Methanoregula TaxID=2649730 RepID=UPI0009CACD9E|nr:MULTISPECIES: 4Fe-4S binding protein [unclassified Methanoregula]OPX64404.1 MAG: Heterodisulfide reductase subunit A-like protein [Methanoregula sp. PtaB.Bin085]OPY34926.1 MAG: Heterodisulfide reductase subunit A-like protein [Methanoregula sp. PtaU1.Bin006]
MRRKIISIDEEKCTGCGRCIPDCPEGALQVIDGKARLVSDLFCDGLGACIGTCPEGAISVIEREAVPYDEKAVMATIARQGSAVIRAHLEHLAGHGQTNLYNQAVEYLIENAIPIPDHTPPERGARAASRETCPPAAGRMGEGVCPPPGPHSVHPFAGCPGTAAQSILRERNGQRMPRQPAGVEASSELRQWPVQLSLLNSAAPYFDNADLLVSADCVPFAYAGFHDDILRGKILIIFCPKLDADVEGYIAKLAEIFTRHTIRSITVARMEVPCCGGVRYVVEKALENAGKKVPVKETMISIRGRIL